MWTRVLKGNIALDSGPFPTGTQGCLLDARARQFLWEVGKDYIHGTFTCRVEVLETTVLNT
jgi:Xaa-Pro aminopeptidase